MSGETPIPISVFAERFEQGFYPLPIIYDVANKTVPEGGHPDRGSGRPTIAKVDAMLKNGFSMANGMAMEMHAPNAMFDIDLKNTEDKTIYDTWFRSVTAISPEISSKVCIERTRSGGYHVYIKYSGLKTKKRLAGSDSGKEVIALYTGPVLSYCYPTPGYELIHNDFNDVSELTDDEFDVMCTCAAAMDKDETNPGTAADKILVDYPKEYENACLQFDQCDEKVFEGVLNSVDLHFEKVKHGKYGDYDLYKRKGSLAAYSAKIYFSCNRCLIFSGSMTQFPSWHDRADENDKSWVLTPARILFYKNKRDWEETIKEIELICESAGIVLTPVPEVVNTNPEAFPFEVFPPVVQEYLKSLQPNIREYAAGGILVAASTAFGNSCYLSAKGRRVIAVIFMALVGEPGGGKTPGLKKGLAPLEQHDAGLYERYKSAFLDFKDRETNWKRDKKAGSAPTAPAFFQTLIKDSTIEMTVKILSTNPVGCALSADELNGFLKRMNRYQDGDELQKWLEIFSGAPVLLQRVNREENKVPDPFCNIIGGIQPGILDQLSANGKDHNGFYHRFLYIYPENTGNPNWEDISSNPEMDLKYTWFINNLISLREGEKKEYTLSHEADKLFAGWYNRMNEKWLQIRDENVRGIISKYKDYYCLRLALLLSVINGDPGCTVGLETMQKAILLIEYFLEQIKKAGRILSPGSPADSLPENKRNLYYSLPEMFTMKTAIDAGKILSFSEKDVRNFLAWYGEKSKERLFEKDSRGNIKRLYW